MKRLILLLACLMVCGLLVPLNAQIQTLRNLRLYDIAYSQLTNKIYGAYGSYQTGGNSILVINPNNGVVEDAIAVKAEPYLVRVSPDQKTLYIGYLGSNSLDKLELTDNKLLEIHSFEEESPRFPGAPFGIFLRPINEILPLPETEAVKAIIGLRDNRSDPETQGMLILKANNQVGDTVSRFENTRSFAFHESTKFIYGAGHSFSRNLVRYRFDENGVYFDQEFSALSSNLVNIQITNDQLFCQSGEVFDISGPVPKQIGNIYSGGNFRRYNGGVIAISPITEKVYNINYESRFSGFPRDGYYLHEINPDDFKPMHSLLLEGFKNRPVKLIPLGGGGKLALITHDSNPNKRPLEGELVLFGGCQVENIDTFDLSLSKAIVCRNDTLRLGVKEQFNTVIWSNGVEGQELILNRVDQVQQISAAAYNVEGCLVALSDTIEIQPQPLASLDQLVLEGIQPKCAYDSVSLSATADNGREFIWSNGQSGATIRVSEPGYYEVLAYTELGCTDGIPKGVFVENHPLTDLPKGRILGEETIVSCDDQTVALQAADDMPAYEWDTPFQNNGRILDTYTFLNEPYRVRYIDQYGCKGTFSEPVSVIYNSSPADPILKKIGYVIKAETNANLEWYFNGQLIPDVLGKDLVPNQRGFYYARSYNEQNCFSDISNIIKVEVPFIEEEYTISGKVYIDLNRNGSMDAEEYFLPNQRVFLKDLNTTRFTDENGAFEFLISPGSYFLDLQTDSTRTERFEGSDGISVNTLSIPSEGFLFGLAPKMTQPEVNLNIQTGLPRCATNMPIWLSIRNKSILPLSGQLCLTIDEKIEETSLDLRENSYCWRIKELRFENTVDRSMSVLIPGVEKIGDALRFSISVLDENGEVVTQKDFNREILCSFDPNDKLVEPRRGENQQYVFLEDTLQYTIRFQNTGNDTAFRVLLLDTLSQDLDWNSLTPVSASHPHDVALNQSTGVLEVIYDNIELPDSTTDFSGSQGYFTFSILPKEGLLLNTILQNTAAIFFDQNPPIITNTVESELVDSIPVVTSLVPELRSKLNYSVYPNPSNENFRLEVSGLNEVGVVQFFDVLGKPVYQQNINLNIDQLEIPAINWPAGLYFYTISSKRRVKFASGKLTKL